MKRQTSRKEQALATRRAILKAAVELTREQSFDKLSVRDICRRAGVTTGAFYHHFLSKDDLLNQGFHSLDDYMEQALAPYRDSPPLERLAVLLDLYARYMEGLGWKTISLYYGRRLLVQNAASVSPDRYTLRTMLTCLQALSAEGALSPKYAPEWTADLLFRHFRGVVVDWVLHEGGYPLRAKLAQDYDLFATALRA